jgi:hypothetical protein
LGRLEGTRMPAHGTFRTCRDVRDKSIVRRKTDVMRSRDVQRRTGYYDDSALNLQCTIAAQDQVTVMTMRASGPRVRTRIRQLSALSP